MLLELFNTLLLCFAATEAVLRKPEKLSTFRTPASVALAVNVFLSEFAARALGSLSLTAAAVLHHVRGAVGTGSTALASCALRLSHSLGASTLVSALISLLLFSVWTGLALTKGQGGGHRALAMRTLSCFVAFCGLRAGLSKRMKKGAQDHATALKASAVAVAFMLLCYFDVRRFRRGITATIFLRELAIALAYVAPLFPCLAVGISVVFFMLISLLEFVRIDPHVLNGAVMYGTLYGPFAWVYFVTKRRCMRANDADDELVLPTIQYHRRRTVKNTIYYMSISQVCSFSSGTQRIIDTMRRRRRHKTLNA